MATQYGFGQTVTRGLIISLDAADRNSYPGSGTTWRDVSSNGNNGSLINSPTFNSANGGNIVFNGSTQYINAPLTKPTTCTFSSWAKTTTLASSPMLFNAGPDGSGPDLFFYLGSIYWNTWDGAGNPFATTPASVTDGNYHNYVVVNDSSLNAKLYYDGNLLGTATYKSAASTTNLTIGGATTTYMWNGSIANFSIYNRALSITEILQNYNAQKSRFDPPPSIISTNLALYLDASNTSSYSGTGTAWNDISGNGRNFTWVSTPTFGNDGLPYFVTSGNRCTGPASNTFGITNQFTIFVICKQISLTQNHGFKFYTTGNNRGIAPHLAWTDSNIYFDTSVGRVTVASGGTTAWNIFVFTSDGTTNTVYKNETSLGSGATGGNLNLISTAVDLGSSDEYGGNSSLWNARLAAFLVYNRGLSASEILQNVNFLKYRFGL